MGLARSNSAGNRRSEQLQAIRLRNGFDRERRGIRTLVGYLDVGGRLSPRRLWARPELWLLVYTFFLDCFRTTSTVERERRYLLCP